MQQIGKEYFTQRGGTLVDTRVNTVHTFDRWWTDVFCFDSVRHKRDRRGRRCTNVCSYTNRPHANQSDQFEMLRFKILISYNDTWCKFLSVIKFKRAPSWKCQFCCQCKWYWVGQQLIFYWGHFFPHTLLCLCGPRISFKLFFFLSSYIIDFFFSYSFLDSSLSRWLGSQPNIPTMHDLSSSLRWKIAPLLQQKTDSASLWCRNLSGGAAVNEYLQRARTHTKFRSKVCAL